MALDEEYAGGPSPEGFCPAPGVALQALQVPRRFKNILPVVTRRFTDEAHERRLCVDVWPHRRAREMREVLDAGVDFVMTDRPDRLTFRCRGPR